jgi:hypothetical protein
MNTGTYDQLSNYMKISNTYFARSLYRVLAGRESGMLINQATPNMEDLTNLSGLCLTITR